MKITLILLTYLYVLKVLQNRVIMIMNPTTKEHFIYGKFFEARGVQGGHNGQVDDVNYIHTTYLDNLENIEAGSLKNIQRMEREQPDKYKHVILGGWRDKAEGCIFNDWSIGKFNDDITSIFGQDFGFSNDPTSLIEVAVDKQSRTIWLKEHLYKKELSTKQITEYNRRYAKKQLIVCDSADPRLWTELRKEGLNMTPTVKFKDSIKTGIALMQDCHIVIDPSSINLIKEFNNYTWKENSAKTVPIDDWNHGIDGARYACQYLLGRTLARGKYILS